MRTRPRKKHRSAGGKESRRTRLVRGGGDGETWKKKGSVCREGVVVSLKKGAKRIRTVAKKKTRKCEKDGQKNGKEKKKFV